MLSPIYLMPCTPNWVLPTDRKPDPPKCTPIQVPTNSNAHLISRVSRPSKSDGFLDYLGHIGHADSALQRPSIRNRWHILQTCQQEERKERGLQRVCPLAQMLTSCFAKVSCTVGDVSSNLVCVRVCVLLLHIVCVCLRVASTSVSSPPNIVQLVQLFRFKWIRYKL